MIRNRALRFAIISTMLVCAGLLSYWIYSIRTQHSIRSPRVRSVEKVDAIRIDNSGTNRPFSFHMIQYTDDPNVFMIATIDQEYLLRLEETSLDGRDSVAEVLPDDVWRVSLSDGYAEFVGPVAWDSTKPTTKVAASGEFDFKRRREVWSRTRAGIPSWWPKGEQVRREGTAYYGNVVPGQSAISYILRGRESKTAIDIWGKVSYYSGPFRLVIELAEEIRHGLYVFDLESIEPVRNGLRVMFSEDGRIAIVSSGDSRYFWLVDLSTIFPMNENSVAEEPG